MSLRLARRADVIRVTGKVSAAATRECERCGHPVGLALAEELELSYVPSDRGDEAHGQELGEGDLDVGWYEQGALDLGDVVSEALALALPSRVVCADEAACDARTAALLAERGEAGERPIHPGLAALKRIG